MTGRADLSLELQLEATHDEAKAETTQTAIDGVLVHLRSSKDRHRRGGKRLVTLLETARAAAAHAEEWNVVRLLQDSLDYAEDRILQPDFDERYRLFQDGKRSKSKRDFVAASLSIAHLYTAEAIQEYAAEHPECTTAELVEHFKELSRDARLLDAPDDRPGRYRLVRGRAELSLWLERVLRERIDVENPLEAAQRIAMSPEALHLLASDNDGAMLFRALEMQRRCAALEGLRINVEDPNASEFDLQRALHDQYWIFGGRYVGQAVQRRLVPGDELDIALIRGDGSLHIVELKRAMSIRHNLVKRYRNSWVPTSQVHDAVEQALNYLVGLDENREMIRSKFGIETRRASAVVLIGHPAAQPTVPEQEINETLRTLNSHLSRVEVLTYKELIDNAERALDTTSI
ncbi:Shedu anti-phage system protein SduA domain-containing protein [Actinomadura decatromicini]|uniref:DUF4263 domain-containing protein n=1 Tax=Actinomadura decatromicini TaxID=2604572 RepID=A0A5D3FRR9_9ACTN|nr:Shedu anti-phage system protein SduA domain-containing protein [Actinomadura decatromicini]TYK50738.1 DUF4263 domain-containing protein [Actinomadura decatromicini]